MLHEREINLPTIVRSDEPSVRSLANTDFPRLIAFVTLCVKSYLDYCYPSQSGMAAMFANDLIETRPAFKAADFIAMFKFFRQRSDVGTSVNSDPNSLNYGKEAEGLKVFGNTLTPQRFIEMVAVYEDHRIQEFEKYQRELRGAHMEKNKHASSDVEKLALKLRAEGKKPTGDRELGRLSEQAAARQEEKRLNGKLREIKIAPDESYFNSVKP